MDLFLTKLWMSGNLFLTKVWFVLSGGAAPQDGAFNFDKFFQNLYDKLKDWGGWIILLAGVIMMIVGIFQIAKGLIQHGKAQTNWIVAIALLLLGGALVGLGGSASAFEWVTKITQGGGKTIEQLGQTVIPYLGYLRL